MNIDTLKEFCGEDWNKVNLRIRGALKSDIDLLVDSRLRGLRFVGLLDDVQRTVGKSVDLFDVTHIEAGSRIDREMELSTSRVSSEGSEVMCTLESAIFGETRIKSSISSCCSSEDGSFFGGCFSSSVGSSMVPESLELSGF